MREKGERSYTIEFYTTADYLKKEQEKPVDEQALRNYFAEQNNIYHRYWTKEKKEGDKVIAPVEQPFEAVAKEVKHDYHVAQAQKAIAQDLESTGIDKKYLKNTQKIVLNPKNKEAELKKLTGEGIDAERVNKMAVEGTTLKGVLADKAYVVTLNSVKKPESTPASDVLELRQEILKDNERFVMAASVDSLVKNAKIKSNNKLDV